MRPCSKCRAELTTGTGPRTCRACQSEYTKAWKKANNSRIRKQTNDRRRAQREEALSHYGGCCACCGENRFEFLAIDHIDGGGNKHRKAVGAGKEFVAWLIRNNYPSGYRVLCHNCNLALGFYKRCPHNNGLGDVAVDEHF